MIVFIRFTIVIIFLNIISTFTIINGINVANHKYDNTNNSKILEGSPLIGFNFGIEKSIDFPIRNRGVRFNIGATFIQRGTSIKVDLYSHPSPSKNIKSSYISEYIAGHILYVFELENKNKDKNKIIFIGFQSGFYINSKNKFGNYVVKNSHNYNSFDCGFLIGGDYMVNDKIGLRLSFYKGFINVFKEAETNNFKFKHIGIQVSFLYYAF